MNKLVVLAALLISGCAYEGEPDVFYFHLVCDSEVETFKDCSNPEFRKRVHDTIEKSWISFGGNPRELRAHWRIIFQDKPIYTYNKGPASGFMDETNLTITILTSDIYTPPNMQPDVARSTLAHEMLHFYFHWISDPIKGNPLGIDIPTGGDSDHSNPKWRDCAMWTNIWDWANKTSPNNICLDYIGTWFYTGNGAGSWGQYGSCNWCASSYTCEPDNNACIITP